MPAMTQPASNGPPCAAAPGTQLLLSGEADARAAAVARSQRGAPGAAETDLVSAEAALTIAAVERDTGLGKDTLRVWERRYGFPAPWRDAHGERRYPQAQVDRLRLVCRLLEAGLRPARVVPLPLSALQTLAAGMVQRAEGSALAGAPESMLLDMLETVQDTDAAALWRQLGRAQSRLGPGRFVTDIVAPLNVAVGQAWLDGRLQVFQEHLYTEVVQMLMRQALASLTAAAPDTVPRVLLTTLPGEHHGLGLLMAQTLLAIEGCVCLSLGLQTPVLDIVAAAVRQRADIVALSSSGCMKANDLHGALTDLRRCLDVRTELWAGGRAKVLERRPIEGVRPVAALASIAGEVERWRGEHAGSVGLRPGFA